MWRENIDEIESSRRNNIWKKINLAIDNERPEKTVKQRKDKLRNFKDLYKRAKESNKNCGSSPDFPPYYDEFNSALSCRVIMNSPDFHEVGIAEKSKVCSNTPSFSANIQFDQESDNEQGKVEQTQIIAKSKGNFSCIISLKNLSLSPLCIKIFSKS